MRALILVYSHDDWLDLDLIHIKVKFGRVCFCVGKKWKLLNFWNVLLPVNFDFVFAIN